jgi:hypothetical protein
MAAKVGHSIPDSRSAQLEHSGMWADHQLRISGNVRKLLTPHHYFVFINVMFLFFYFSFCILCFGEIKCSLLCICTVSLIFTSMYIDSLNHFLTRCTRAELFVKQTSATPTKQTIIQPPGCAVAAIIMHCLKAVLKMCVRPLAKNIHIRHSIY